MKNLILKWLGLHTIVADVEHLEANTDDVIRQLVRDNLDDVKYDMDNKLSYDDVVDEINDRTVDTINDVKELKVLCDVLTRNNDLLMEKDKLNNDSIDNLIERDLLVNEVIQAIINKLERNENV